MNSQTTSFLFERWPRLASRHPWSVLAGALAALLVFAALFFVFGGSFSDSFSLPGTESQRLVDLLEERFPERAGDTATVVVRAPAGLDEAEVRGLVESLLADLESLPDVIGVSSPYVRSGSISSDGLIGQITVQYVKQASDLERSSIDALHDVRNDHSSGGLASGGRGTGGALCGAGAAR